MDTLNQTDLIDVALGHALESIASLDMNRYRRLFLTGRLQAEAIENVIIVQGEAERTAANFVRRAKTEIIRLEAEIERRRQQLNEFSERQSAIRNRRTYVIGIGESLQTLTIQGE